MLCRYCNSFPWITRTAEFSVYSALEAMAGALDRYSFFVPPDLIGVFSESLKDRHIGIGIHIAKNGNGTIEVISTEPDGPAYKAGINHDIIILTASP